MAKKRPPTANQIAVALKVVEKLKKGERIKMGPIMREVGYADTCADHPKLALTGTEAWQDLMEEYLPDLKLMQVHAEGLDATRTISASVVVKSNDPTVKNKQANARDVDFIDVPDYAVRHRYMETGYRLKGRLKDVVIDNSKQIIQIELTDETNTKPSTIKNIPGHPQIQGDSSGSEIREDNISLSEDNIGSS